MLGGRIGRYRLEGEEQGRGGMGTILRGVDDSLGRPAALKLLSCERLSSQADALDALRREARAVARLKHPHIAALYEFGEDPQQPYLAMEWVEGTTLQERLSQGPFSPPDALHLVGQILGALDYAHLQGVLHRDIKPANLMLSAGGQKVTLVDFGLATLLAEPATVETGPMLGTPLYLPPEVAAGEPVDGRADLYSAALVLFEMLTGKPAFGPGTVAQIVSQQLGAARPVLSEHAPGVPAALDPVLEKAMARHPADRYATGADFLTALRHALEPSPRTASFPSKGFLLMATAAVLLTMAALRWLPPATVENPPVILSSPSPKATAPPPEWSPAQRDPAGTHAVEEISASKPRTIWEEHLEAPGPLASAGALLLTATSQGRLEALEAATGRTAWRLQLPGLTSTQPILSPRESPTQALVAGPQSFLGIGLRDGKTLWESPFPNPAGAVLSDDDVLYVAAGSTLTAVDPASGKPTGQASVGAPILDVPPVLASSVVFVLTENLRAKAFDLTTLEEVWSVTLPSRPSCLALTPQGNLLVGCHDGRVLCYSLITRAELWELGESDFSPVLGLSAAPDLVLVTCQQGELAAYDDQGYLTWQESLPGEPAGPVQTDGELVLVGMRSGEVLCLEAETSRQVWALELQRTLLDAPLIVDSWIFLPLEGELTALRSLANVPRTPPAPRATP